MMGPTLRAFSTTFTIFIYFLSLCEVTLGAGSQGSNCDVPGVHAAYRNLGRLETASPNVLGDPVSAEIQRDHVQQHFEFPLLQA